MNRTKPRRMSQWLITTMSLAALGACGGEADKAASEGAGEAPPTAIAAASKLLPSEECEPELSAAPRAAGLPVDDIAGLRPGLPVGDVQEVLRCRGNIGEIVVEDNFFLRGTGEVETRQRLVASSGTPCESHYNPISGSSDPECGTLMIGDSRKLKNRDDIFQVALVGMPGEERAFGVWRTQTFEGAERPVHGQLLAQLTAKYGEPNYESDRGSTRVYGWIHDLRGRPMSENNPSFNRCLGINADYEGSQRWTADCGLTVEAGIETSRDNPELVQTFHIASVDQSGFSRAIDGLRQELAAAEAARLEAEVERARQVAAPVEL